MLKAANDKATVKAVDDDLANKAVKAAKADDGSLKADATLKNDVKTALSKGNDDKYVWYTYVETKDLNKTTKAQKIAKELIVAVKEGGSADPAYNSRLATVITKAKAANMPNDNIKRCLEKAAGAGGDNYETITYEGHGPCGVAVIVETMTDNRNRTAGSVRHHFDKYGGSLGTNGCVSWSFDRKGVIVIDNEDEELDEDTVMMDALDAGAADFQPEEGCFTVYTDPDSINDVAKALEDKGYKFDSAQIEMVPQTYQKLEKQEDRDNMEKMLDLFEDDDDVQNVWHNWDQE